MRRFLGTYISAMALVLALFAGNPLIDSELVDRVECLFIVTVNEGHSWEQCLS